MTNAAPFPWRSLDAVRRADVSLLAKMRRAATRIIDFEGSTHALDEMLGRCELSIRLRRVTSNPPRVDAAAVGVLLAPGERADQRHAFAVILEQSLAGALAARALRRPAPRIVDAAAQVSPSLAGAMGALLVAAARRCARAPLRVIATGSAQSILAEIVALDALPIGVTFTVLVDHDAHLAHAFAPRSAVEPLRDPDLDAAGLVSLGSTPLEVPLVGAVLTMTVVELAALSPGDALFPVDRESLWLSPETSDVGFRVNVAEDGRLVLRDGPHPLLEEKTVDKDALAQTLGDTPVVVRVEIGMAQMTAREWAALGSGDVIAIGKRIGEHVVLRVGGVEVARGELVDLEGEVGVRIVSRGNVA
jgi:flagellar motor switch/type III secretory pathway protein FliN